MNVLLQSDGGYEEVGGRVNNAISDNSVKTLIYFLSY